MNKLLGNLTQISGVTKRFDHATFHEAVIRLPIPACDVLEGMAARGVLGGYDLGRSWACLDDCLLVNVTETKSEADLLTYENCLVAVLEEASC